MADRVLITGASSGIGEAAAYAFSSEASELFLVSRRSERLRKIAEECRSKGSGRVVTSAHDLSVPGEGTRIVEECLTSLGGLDVLICNAGYGIYQPVTETTPEAMSRIWQVNYQSGFESIHAALPRFLEKGRGHIILTSSIIGKKGLAYAGAYCATKFAQVGLGEALWGELKGTGVGLSVICPGYTATEFHGVASGDGRSPVNRPFQGQHPRVAAAAMVRAVKRKKRETILTLPGKTLILLNRLSPTLAAHVMALVGRREYAPKGP